MTATCCAARLLAFAQRHGLPAVSISGLIHHRLLDEGALRRSHTTELATPYGRFTVHAYHDVPVDALHLALVLGQPDPGVPVLTRVQTVEMQRDVLGFGTPALRPGRRAVRWRASAPKAERAGAAR